MAERPGPQLGWWRRALLAMAGVSSRTLSLQNDDDVRLLAGAPVSATGRHVTATTAMRVSAYWACNKILSETLGMLPLSVYERLPDGNSKKVDDHPLALVLSSTPNADMTSQEFREAVQLNLGIHGNGYCFRNATRSGEVTSLYPIPSGQVKLKRIGGEITYEVLEKGQWKPYPRDRIWHVKAFGNDGLVGLSPVAAARESLGLSMATEEFQARFFGQGARPSAVAEIPQWLKPDQRKIARENLQTLLGGLDSAHRVHLLEGGMKLNEWGKPLQDLQFLELRGFQIPDICRFYLMPPHRVQDLSRSTNNNIEQQSLEFVSATMMPWFTRWEGSANRWLLPPRERAKYFVRFNVDALLRADIAGRADFYSKAVQNGWMTRNEVRGKENLNSDPALDGYTVQTNMTPLDKLPALIDAQIKKGGTTSQSQQGNQP